MLLALTHLRRGQHGGGWRGLPADVGLRGVLLARPKRASSAGGPKLHWTPPGDSFRWSSSCRPGQRDSVSCLCDLCGRDMRVVDAAAYATRHPLINGKEVTDPPSPCGYGRSWQRHDLILL